MRDDEELRQGTVAFLFFCKKIYVCAKTENVCARSSKSFIYFSHFSKLNEGNNNDKYEY